MFSMLSMEVTRKLNNKNIDAELVAFPRISIGAGSAFSFGPAQAAGAGFAVPGAAAGFGQAASGPGGFAAGAGFGASIGGYRGVGGPYPMASRMVRATPYGVTTTVVRYF